MATFDGHKNFAYSLVATAPSPPSSGTSLVVTAGGGALMPAVPFNVTIWPTASIPTAANAEVARVTNVSTDTLTIVRAQEGSAARTVLVGDQIAATATTKTFTDIETQANIVIANDTIWDTKGDLVAATGADAAAKVAVGANGTVLTADSTQSTGVAWNVPPGTVVDYVTTSSNTTVSATTAATANTHLTGAGFTPNGTDSFWIEFYAARGDTAAVAGATIIVTVYDNGSELTLGGQTNGQIAQLADPAAAAFIAPLFGKVKVTPTNASHTYSIRAWRSGGNGLIAAGGAFMPSYMMVYKAF